MTPPFSQSPKLEIWDFLVFPYFCHHITVQILSPIHVSNLCLSLHSQSCCLSSDSQHLLPRQQSSFFSLLPGSPSVTSLSASPRQSTWHLQDLTYNVILPNLYSCCLFCPNGPPPLLNLAYTAQFYFKKSSTNITSSIKLLLPFPGIIDCFLFMFLPG